MVNLFKKIQIFTLQHPNPVTQKTVIFRKPPHFTNFGALPWIKLSKMSAGTILQTQHTPVTKLQLFVGLNLLSTVTTLQAASIHTGITFCGARSSCSGINETINYCAANPRTVPNWIGSGTRSIATKVDDVITYFEATEVITREIQNLNFEPICFYSLNLSKVVNFIWTLGKMFSNMNYFVGKCNKYSKCSSNACEAYGISEKKSTFRII